MSHDPSVAGARRTFPVLASAVERHLGFAALADRHELGVLHYDRDYDLLAEKTDLDFASVWLAPPGTI